jgi:hypothetical protein
MDAAHYKDPMIRANCRARFTAADFDFIVKTLGRSRGESVNLLELLADLDSRDAILDQEALVHAILNGDAHLAISPQFYFYVLTRHVLKTTGVNDRVLSDYLASLLEAFSHTARMRSPSDTKGNPLDYLSDMLLALRDASPVQTFLIRAHVGNYSLFLSGIFPERVQRRCERGAPDFSYYEEMGSMNFKVVANHSVARSCDLTPIYEELSRSFHEIRLALNRLSDQLLNLDDERYMIPLLG